MRGAIGKNVWGRGGSYGRATESRFWERETRDSRGFSATQRTEHKESERETVQLNERTADTGARHQTYSG